MGQVPHGCATTTEAIQSTALTFAYLITLQVPDGGPHRKPDRDVPRVTDDLRSAVCVGLAPVRLAFPKRFQKQHKLFASIGVTR